MATEIQLIPDLPMQASANAAAVTWSGNPPVPAGGIPQYTAVVLDTTASAWDVVLPGAAGVPIVGINQSAEPTGPGASMEVRMFGVSKAIASGAITVGQVVYVANTSGQLGPAPAAGATNSYVVGMAISPATAAGDTFTVLLWGGFGATQVTS